MNKLNVTNPPSVESLKKKKDGPRREMNTSLPVRANFSRGIQSSPRDVSYTKEVASGLLLSLSSRPVRVARTQRRRRIFFVCNLACKTLSRFLSVAISNRDARQGEVHTEYE